MKPSYKPAHVLVIITAFFLSACASRSVQAEPAVITDTAPAPAQTVDMEFTLQTIAEKGKLLYIGMGGEIDGVVNPDLVVPSGAVIRIVLINSDGMVHDLFLPDFDVKTDYVRKIGDQTEILFETGDMHTGSYVYYCTLPGHRKAGQEGKFIIVKP